jgi:tight adherence protein B
VTSPLLALLAAAALVLAVPRPRLSRAARLADAGRLAGVMPTRRRAGPLPRPPTRLLLAGAVGVLLTALTVSLGPALAGAGAVAWGLAALLCRDGVRRREEARRRAEMAAALRIVVGELEAGAAPAAALEAAVDVAPRFATELREASDAARAGKDPGTSLADAQDPDLRALGCAWRVSTSTGAPLAGVLDRLGADWAALDAQRCTVAGALAGPRSSALVLAGLPVLGAALGAGMGARPLHFLFAVPAGRLLCCAGAVLDAAGVLWMRALLRRAERP